MNCRGIRCACALAVALVSWEAQGAGEQEGVVVLHSGGILQGHISASGERYVVTRPNSVVDVTKSQVLLVADSLDDAYQQQREQLPRDTAEAHLRLAEWCLRHELLQPAAQELADARRIDPHDPRIALLDRRLAVISRPIPSRPAAAQAATQNTTLTKDELQELEAVAAELPAGVVERFTRKVQPLLVNSCTTAGCHQASGAEKFQLDRAVLHGLSNRRTTLRNLVATLELVNRDMPQQSALLAIPRRSHGDMDRPIFGPRQAEQLLQLVDWVALLTETNVVAEPTPSASDETATSNRSPANGRALVDRQVHSANFESQERLAPKHALRFGAELSPWRPKDAFDPEIFNRQSPDAVSAKSDTVAEPPPTH